MRAETQEGKLIRQLTLFDAIMCVVSGTIGASIFITPADVLRAVSSPSLALFLWVIAGGITLLAGLACAELGGMFPESGGQYVFIREAYGRPAGFMYGWILFTAGNSGGLAAMLISCAMFLGRAFPALRTEDALLSASFFGLHWTFTREALIAIAALIILTAVNMRSVRFAKYLQNLTALVYLGTIVGISLIAFLWGHGSWSHVSAATGRSVSGSGVVVAMIALLWSYDGWEFVSWVAGEIKHPRRNLPLALICGILLIMSTYLLVNMVFLYALPPHVLAAQGAPAGAVFTALFNSSAGRSISLFIALICFGAASVVVLGGARIYYSMARDGAFFHRMLHVHPRWHTPTASLFAQCAWVLVLIASGTYEQLYTCFIFMMTLTYIATVGALFVLRRTQPDRPRPYLCPGYPWLPLAYLIVATVFVALTLRARPLESLAGLALALLGLPLYWHWRKKTQVAVEVYAMPIDGEPEAVAARSSKKEG
jgi:APA family basic amino acid/polyamine antiporter